MKNPFRNSLSLRTDSKLFGTFRRVAGQDNAVHVERLPLSDGLPDALVYLSSGDRHGKSGKGLRVSETALPDCTNQIDDHSVIGVFRVIRPNLAEQKETDRSN